MRTILRLARLAILSAAAWAASTSAAFAERMPDTPQKTGYDYTFAYGLVLLAIILGLLCILRPSGRQREAGPQQYVAKNLPESDEK